MNILGDYYRMKKYEFFEKVNSLNIPENIVELQRKLTDGDVKFYY